MRCEYINSKSHHSSWVWGRRILPCWSTSIKLYSFISCTRLNPINYWFCKVLPYYFKPSTYRITPLILPWYMLIKDINAFIKSFLWVLRGVNSSHFLPFCHWAICSQDPQLPSFACHSIFIKFMTTSMDHISVFLLRRGRKSILWASWLKREHLRPDKSHMLGEF